MKKLLVVLAVLGLSLAVAQDDEVFVIQSLPGGPVSFDPVRAYDSASGEVLQNVYETLFYYDGEAIDQFVPQLATDFSVSDDGTSYTFTLREGVMFHSGNMMSCKDVEYSLQYGMVVSHPRGANAHLRGNQFLGTQIDSSDPATFMEAVSFDMIDAAVTCSDGPDGPDGLTAQLNLTKPDPALLAILAYTAFSVIDSEWAIANGMWDGTADTYADWAGRDVEQEFMHRNTSGTGAYRLVDWNEEAVVLEAFDDYWGGAPDIENVVIQYIETDTARILALQQGDADIITINERAELIKLRGSEGVTIVEGGLGDTGVTAIFFNFGINTDENEDVGSGQLDGNGIPADFFTDVDVPPCVCSPVRPRGVHRAAVRRQRLLLDDAATAHLPRLQRGAASPLARPRSRRALLPHCFRRGAVGHGLRVHRAPQRRQHDPSDVARADRGEPRFHQPQLPDERPRLALGGFPDSHRRSKGADLRPRLGRGLR